MKISGQRKNWCRSLNYQTRRSKVGIRTVVTRVLCSGSKSKMCNRSKDTHSSKKDHAKHVFHHENIAYQ